MKKFYALLAALFALLVLLVPAPSLAAEKPALTDSAGILSQEEVKQVNDALTAVGKKHNAQVLVLTVNTTAGASAGDFANRAVDQLKDPKAENGAVLLLLAMDTRDWYVATDKVMKDRITSKDGVEALSSAFLPKLKEGKYADAFEAYGKEADEQLTYYEREGEPYAPSSDFSFMTLGLAFIISLVIGFMVRKHLIAQMSNVMPAPAADAYLDEGSFHLTEKKDTFLFMNVTRVKKEKKTSSADENHGGSGGKF